MDELHLELLLSLLLFIIIIIVLIIYLFIYFFFNSERQRTSNTFHGAGERQNCHCWKQCEFNM